MEKIFWKLSETEKKDKYKYLKNGKKYFSNPLTFSKFAQLSDKLNKKDLEKFYRETTKNGNGLTIVENNYFSHEPIYVSVHPRYSYPVLHNHEFMELIYVYHGQCVNYADGRAVYMKQGTLCFMAPETIHALVANEDDDIIINVLLEKRSFSEYFEDLIQKKGIIGSFFRDVLFGRSENPYMMFTNENGNNSEIDKLFLQIFLESKNKELSYQEMIALKLRMAFICIERNNKMTLVKPKLRVKSKNEIIEAIINYIAIHCNDVTLSKISGIFSYSETYLSKLIKEQTGSNFKDLLETDRLNQAKYLIENTNLPLADISQRVGYFDYSHMSRSFKRMLNITPKSLRKKFDK